MGIDKAFLESSTGNKHGDYQLMKLQNFVQKICNQLSEEAAYRLKNNKTPFANCAPDNGLIFRMHKVSQKLNIHPPKSSNFINELMS